MLKSRHWFGLQKSGSVWEHLVYPIRSVPKNWEKNLRRYNIAYSLRMLNKVDFWEVFSPSWNQAMTMKNIMAGFRNTGIYPYDPLATSPSSMAPSEVTDYGEKSYFWCWFWCSFNSWNILQEQPAYVLFTVFSSSLILSSKSIFSDSWIIFTGTACLRFYKEKKHIQLNVCFAWPQ